MRVVTLASLPELQARLGFPRPGVVQDAELDLVDDEAPPESRRRDAEILCTLAANTSGDCVDLGPACARSVFHLAGNLGDRGRVFFDLETVESPSLVILDLSDPAELSAGLTSAAITLWHGFDPQAPPRLSSPHTEWLHVSGSNLLIGRPQETSTGNWPVGIPLRSQRPGSARGQVSVIMPNYNHGRYLAEAVEALVHQSVAPLEILVMEHGSTDESPEILGQLARQYPSLRWDIHSRDRHFVEHVNDLSTAALGEYICFAAADDFVLPGFLEQSLTILNQHPKAGFSAADVRLADRNSQLLETYPAPVPSMEAAYISPNQNLELLWHNLGGWAMGNACLIRRSVFLEAGPFDLSLGSFCDGFLRMAIGQLWGACYVPAPLAAWRKLEDGYASSTEQDEQKLLACYQRAKELMESRYADWFPATFIEHFTARLITPLEQRIKSCAPSPAS